MFIFFARHNCWLCLAHLPVDLSVQFRFKYIFSAFFFFWLRLYCDDATRFTYQRIANGLTKTYAKTKSAPNRTEPLLTLELIAATLVCQQSFRLQHTVRLSLLTFIIISFFFTWIFHWIEDHFFHIRKSLTTFFDFSYNRQQIVSFLLAVFTVASILVCFLIFRFEPVIFDKNRISVICYEFLII